MNENRPIILVSACLLGAKVRYDGKSKPDKRINELLKYYDIIPVCPEVDGGLKTPRDPSEIQGERVVSSKGRDVTSFFHEGAYKALTVAQYKKVEFAILKDNSPSCGVNKIHDGSFNDVLIPGMGVAAKMLKNAGIKIYSEKDIEDLLIRASKLD